MLIEYRLEFNHEPNSPQIRHGFLDTTGCHIEFLHLKSIHPETREWRSFYQASCAGKVLYQTYDYLDATRVYEALLEAITDDLNCKINITNIGFVRRLTK